MADTTLRSALSVTATTGNRLPDLGIRDGQLIFVQDRHRIAFDFKGKRVFYNQIEEVDTEVLRQALSDPDVGYYFVIDTAVLWYFGDDGWHQLTTPPRDVMFIGVELPELGSVHTLYVDTQNELIAVWDDETDTYKTVSDKTKDITEDDIAALFM